MFLGDLGQFLLVNLGKGEGVTDHSLIFVKSHDVTSAWLCAAKILPQSSSSHYSALVSSDWI
jgi:hypothetical protein